MSTDANAISSNTDVADANINDNAPRIREEGDVVTPPTLESLEMKTDKGDTLDGKRPDNIEADGKVENKDSETVDAPERNELCESVDTKGKDNLTSTDEPTAEMSEKTPDSLDENTDITERSSVDGTDAVVIEGDKECDTKITDTNDAEAKDSETAPRDLELSGKNSTSDTNGAEAKDSETSQTTPGDLEAAGGNGTAKASSPGDSIYHVKWIYFKKKSVPIITQNENGPCPLLAILNVLLLQARVKLPANADIVTANQLMTYLGDCVLKNVPSGSDENSRLLNKCYQQISGEVERIDDYRDSAKGVAASARLNFEQNMQDAVAVMYKLQTGIDVNVRFTGIKDFEYTPECIIFDLLQISLYHGWLVDPQNVDEVTAVGTCSYNQLVEKIILQKTSDQTEIVSQALVAEQFLENSASQLTYHGLSELCSQLKDDELVVLFRNNHFTTLYRHNNELFQLVTDQGLLHESNVVWETLSNVEGDCHFVDSDFRTYTKPEPVFNPVENANAHLIGDNQIDQDYMVALSIQQEQQDQMAWAQVDPQQPMPMPPLSDLELARSLQEEERRAAMAEQERGQQRQQAQPGSPRAQGGNGAQRPPQRDDSRESKKSDCCIL